MGYELTKNIKNSASKQQKTPQLILQIDGKDIMYSFVESSRTPRYDGEYNYNDPELFYDLKIKNPNIKDYISINGTTKNITQQLNQDKGGTGSISSMSINIVDRNNEVSNELLTSEILTTKAKIYIGFGELEFPNDFISIFSGIISYAEADQGTVKLIVDNPTTLTNQDIFVNVKDNITAAIDSSVTTISIESTTGILENQDSSQTYIQIEDEVILIGSISGNSFIGCTRGQFGTIAIAHDIDSDVSTFYRLTGNPLDLGLKIMLSSKDEFFKSLAPLAFNQGVANAIYFDNYNIEDDLGLTVGDYVSITDSTLNDTLNTEIISFGQTDTSQSYIVVAKTLVSEPVLINTLVSFASQWNLLPDGCGMHPDEVDVNQYNYVKDTFGQSFPTMDFYLKDTINAKEFIETELLFPVGAYYLPRKGRASVGYTAPPLSLSDTLVLNEENVTSAGSIKVNRSIKKNFYNNIVYNINESALDNKFLSNIITISGESLGRLRTGSKPMTVDSKGLRGVDAKTFAGSISNRLLDRFQFAAESFKIGCNYGTGFSIEVGDTVNFDGTKLNIFDSTTGTRGTFNRIMEVSNKSMDITTGKISLELTDTNFDTGARYGTISPSSNIETATITSITIKRSFGTLDTEEEGSKWVDYVGLNAVIRDENFTSVQNVVIESISESNVNTLNVSGLSTIPSASYILEIPDYDNADNKHKIQHGFLAPEYSVLSGTSQTLFTIETAALLNIFVGSVLDIHNDNYSQRSNKVTITNITGNDVTVDTDIGFIPSSSHKVADIGFIIDEGVSYRYF